MPEDFDDMESVTPHQGTKDLLDSDLLNIGAPGSGGGPQERNVTALLARSLHTGWSRGSVVAIDAGVHLSAITKVLEASQPQGLGTSIGLPHILGSGPFAGMELKSTSPSVNAGHVTRHLIDTFLITHPHLDHISGFVINTAGLGGARPKRLAGLPSTISAFKQHIFNNVIWPNLSDENNGAGLVTYMRLVEGGSPALGEGDGKGYLEISDGLGVRIFSVSHGHCMERNSNRASSASSRFGSFDAASLTASPRAAPGSTAASGPSNMFRTSGASTDKETISVYDSSAYFVRDNATGREVLVFGDVEPDSISLSPRNLIIWWEAAPRIAKGNLVAIFIECSYDNSQSDDCLFGHLTPKYLIEELQSLAAAVEAAKAPKTDPVKKRKRDVEVAVNLQAPPEDAPVSPKSTRPSKKGPGSMEHSCANSPHIATPTAELSLKDVEANMGHVAQVPQSANVLRGLKVVIIHVKEKLIDVVDPKELILSQLLAAEEEAQLGCEFIVSSQGQSFLL
ncbi:cAMP phosphodiesterase class-II [Astrocystis sublimbata]|nr:cAMP phosphodiesterase class-II [Astrocystis sublimbata]